MKFTTIWTLRGMGLRERWSRTVEWAAIKAAWALPRPVAYWAAIRVGVHATTGEWSGQEVPALLHSEALQRWGYGRDGGVPVR